MKNHPKLLNLKPSQGSAPNLLLNSINSCICSGSRYLDFVFNDLHSIARYLFPFPTNKSGEGRGVDPDPALLYPPKPFSQNIANNSLSALLPFALVPILRIINREIEQFFYCFVLLF